MNKILTCVLCAAVVAVLSAGETLAARGGGRPGGGRPGAGLSGGGGLPGGGAINRTPSNHMSPVNAPGAGANFSRSNLTPGNRMGIGQLPGVGQGLNASQRGTIGNLQGFGENRSGLEYRSNRMNYDNWRHGNWHGPWNHPWHPYPAAWWTAGYLTGWAVATAPWSWGYWSYYNPYYTSEMVVDGTSVDYSQPIVLASQSEYPIDNKSTAAQLATQSLDAARASFMQGDYETALSNINKAIAKLPGDTVLHEFRGLVLFALERYPEAAAAVYAVLAVGPGWDWTTLGGLYPNVDVYSEQLRALEQYIRDKPRSAEAHFLLAYHYMTAGHTNAAVKQFKEVVALNPMDQLSAQLLESLSTPPDAGQKYPDKPISTVKPVDVADLAGTWKTTRTDGATITLVLATDGSYSWKFAQREILQEFSGAYTVVDNLLILKQENNPVMVGQATPLSGDRFNFKLAGDNPNDPGLTFVK